MLVRDVVEQSPPAPCHTGWTSAQSQLIVSGFPGVTDSALVTAFPQPSEGHAVIMQLHRSHSRQPADTDGWSTESSNYPSVSPFCRWENTGSERRGTLACSTPSRFPVGKLAGGDPEHVLEAQNHRESMRLMNSRNIARVTSDPAPPSPKQSNSLPEAPAP